VFWSWRTKNQNSCAFARSQRAKYPFKPDEISFNGKDAFAKALILVGLPLLMHFWTVFGIASIADHKHQSVEQVLIFSYLRTTFPNSCVSVYFVKSKIFNWSRHWKQKIWKCDELCREILARTENDRLAREVHFSDESATSHIKEKVNWHIGRFWRTEVDAAEVISVLCYFK
jgi:hypothetical protein